MILEMGRKHLKFFLYCNFKYELNIQKMNTTNEIILFYSQQTSITRLGIFIYLFVIFSRTMLVALCAM
jgi:hypothetical protein